MHAGRASFARPLRTRLAPLPCGLESTLRDVPPFRLGTQGAQVFNQPLSFDTSSVTDIHDMFEVRLAHSRARCRPHRDILLSVSHASSAPQHTLPAAQRAISVLHLLCIPRSPSNLHNSLPFDFAHRNQWHSTSR